jgi:hypothetical protein
MKRVSVARNNDGMKHIPDRIAIILGGRANLETC